MRRAAAIVPSLWRRLGPASSRPLHVSRPIPFPMDRTTKEGDPGEIRTEEEQCCDKEGDKKQTVAAGRVVTPELDKQTYAPEGMGQDPAEQGGHLKPGDSAGGEEYWADKEKEGSSRKTAPLVEDKITGEKLRDTEVLTDRKAG